MVGMATVNINTQGMACGEKCVEYRATIVVKCPQDPEALKRWSSTSQRNIKSNKKKNMNKNETKLD